MNPIAHSRSNGIRVIRQRKRFIESFFHDNLNLVVAIPDCHCVRRHRFGCTLRVAVLLLCKIGIGPGLPDIRSVVDGLGLTRF